MRAGLAWEDESVVSDTEFEVPTGHPGGNVQ